MSDGTVHPNAAAAVPGRISDEARLGLALAASNTGLFDWDLRTNRVLYSPEWKRQIGYQDRDLSDDFAEWRNRAHPDDVDRVLAAFEACLRDPSQPFEVEIRFRHRAGHYLWILTRAEIARNAAGEPVSMRGCHIDVTERKRAEEALRRRELKTQRLLSESQEIAHIGSWAYDLTTQEVTWSEEMYRLYGVSPSGFVPDPSSFFSLTHLVHPDDRAAMSAWIDDCAAGKNPGELEFRCVSPTGEVRVLSGRGALQRDAEDRPIRLVGTGQDITERKQAEEALRERENRLRLFVEHSPAAIAMFDRDMRYLVTSRRWLADHRLTGQEVIGRSHYDACPDIPERWKEIHRRCLAGATDTCDEDPFVHADGAVDWVRWDIRPWHTAQNEIGGIIIFSEVITERRATADAVRKSERRLRDLIDGLGPSMLVGLMTPDGTLIEANRAALVAAGIKPQDVLGQPFEETYWWTHSEEVQRQLRAAIDRAADGEASRYDVRVRGANGQLIDIDFSLQPLRDEGGSVVFLVASANVITERKRAEEGMRTLSRKLLVAQEEERRRIARELHDELGQVLTATKLTLQDLERHSGDAFTERLARARDSLDRGLESVRSLALQLRPALLDDLGLVPALRWSLDRLGKDTGIATHLIAEEGERFGPEIETACFRVVQEALTNVARHAGAHEVTVELRRDGDRLRLSVVDDGCGFDPGAVMAGASMGLAGMRERIALLGGLVDVRSTPSMGTRIDAVLPLAPSPGPPGRHGGRA